MKNKYQKQRIIGAIIGIVGIVLALIGIMASEVILIIGIVVAVVGLLWYLTATVHARRVCDKCGGSMEGCAYTYQTVSQGDVNSNGTYRLKIEINATCPHCGYVKTFFDTVYIGVNENPQYKVDKCCKSYFGH